MISPDIKTPEYGIEILSRFSKDITIYDYTEMDDSPHHGIHLIHYDGRLNAKINYLENGVVFLIEDDYYKYLNNQIWYENLISPHYEYFAYYLNLLKEEVKHHSELSSKFRNELPVEWLRDQKIKELI